MKWTAADTLVTSYKIRKRVFRGRHTPRASRRWLEEIPLSVIAQGDDTSPQRGEARAQALDTSSVTCGDTFPSQGEGLGAMMENRRDGSGITYKEVICMAKKYPPIKTVSYCYVNGVKTCTDDLTPEQQEKLGSEIQRILAENLFRGQVVFHKPGEEPEQTA